MNYDAFKNKLEQIINTLPLYANATVKKIVNYNDVNDHCFFLFCTTGEVLFINLLNSLEKLNDFDSLSLVSYYSDRPDSTPVVTVKASSVGEKVLGEI